MATFLPSSGAISINDINSVFSRGNNLNAYRGTVYCTASTGAASYVFPSGTISISDFYGTGPSPNFTLAFNNGDNFNVTTSNPNNPDSASISINTDGSMPHYGSLSNIGPTAWGSPNLSGVGDFFECRLIISSVSIGSIYSPLPTFTFAGTSYTGAATTPWVAITSNRLIQAYSGYADVSSSGTIEIRNTSTLTTISRAYYMYAQGTQP